MQSKSLSFPSLQTVAKQPYPREAVRKRWPVMKAESELQRSQMGTPMKRATRREVDFMPMPATSCAMVRKVPVRWDVMHVMWCRMVRWTVFSVSNDCMLLGECIQSCMLATLLYREDGWFKGGADKIVEVKMGILHHYIGHETHDGGWRRLIGSWWRFWFNTRDREQDDRTQVCVTVKTAGALCSLLLNAGHYIVGIVSMFVLRTKHVYWYLLVLTGTHLWPVVFWMQTCRPGY